MIRYKIIAASLPFIMLSNSTSEIAVEQVGGLAGTILKYGELGLCLVLVAYLIWSNWTLVNSLQVMMKDKTAQEERLIGVLHEFCSVCRQRPCLMKSAAFDSQNVDGIVNKETTDVS
ncbi:MAG: hypothetical protein WC496_02815 [Phycisphaerae bacterium]|jgi:hypothetical protein